MMKYRNLFFVLMFLVSKQAASSEGLSGAFEEAAGAGGGGVGCAAGAGGSGPIVGSDDGTGLVAATSADDDYADGAYYPNPYRQIKEIAEAVGSSYETLHLYPQKTLEVILNLLKIAIIKLSDEVATGDRQIAEIKSGSEREQKEKAEALSRRLFPNKPDPFTTDEILKMINPRILELHLNIFKDHLRLLREVFPLEAEIHAGDPRVLGVLDGFFRAMLNHLSDYFSHRKISIESSGESAVYIIPTSSESVVAMQKASQYHNLKSVQYTVTLLDFKIALLRLSLPWISTKTLEENEMTIRNFGLDAWLAYTELPTYPADPDSLVHVGNSRFVQQKKTMRQHKEKTRKGKGDLVSMIDGTALASKKDLTTWRNLLTSDPKPLPDFSKRTPYIGGKAPNPSAPVIEEIISLFNSEPSIETLSRLKGLLGGSDDIVRDFMRVLLGEAYVQQYIGKGLALLTDQKDQVNFMKDINKLVDPVIAKNIRAEFRKNSTASSEAGAAVPLDATDDDSRARKESETKEQERKAFVQKILKLNERMGSNPLYLSFRVVLPPVEWEQIGGSEKYYPAEPVQLTSGQRRTLGSIGRTEVSFDDASSLLKRLGFLVEPTSGSHKRFVGPIVVTLVKEHEGSDPMGVSRDMVEILKHLSLLNDDGSITANVIMRH